MRVFVALLLLSVIGCPAPAPGSLEWVARHYSEALLQNNTQEMQKHAATGLTIQPTNRNPGAAALHVVKLCPQGKNSDNNKKNLLVLIGGSLNGDINGIDMVLIKEGAQWRILYAKLSVDERGVKNYLRNCQEDTRQMSNKK
jgi:hypothetical protein